MQQPVHIAVDSLVAAAVPGLTTLPPADDLRLAVFNAFESPTAIADNLKSFKPDVILVDSVWLVLAALLESLAKVSGLTTTRRVVGAKVVDDVLKIQAAHRGMVDVVNLNNPAPQVLEHLKNVHNGESTLANDELWKRVPRPTAFSDITATPQDATDLAILELICIGYRDQDIAEALHYSVQSVKNRLGIMMKRSGVANRTQLAWQFTNQLLIARMVEQMEHAKGRDASTPES